MNPLVYVLVLTAGVSASFIELKGLLTQMVLEQGALFMEGFVTSFGHDQSGYPILPEAKLDTLEIIKMNGYHAEVHEVVTSDGYVIQIFRLNLVKCKELPSVGHPVLLQHGILTNSAIWLMNEPKDSLGFVLADECYDVWLGNIRGGRYGRRHLRLSPHDQSFWDFSLDDHALLDFPAVVDHVLQVTGHPKLSLVAHSMGTTISLFTLAALPQYNKKVDAIILQAPVMYGRFLKNPLRIVVHYIKEMTKLVNELGLKEFPPPSPLLRGFALTLCTEPPLTILCEAVITSIGGYDDQLINRRRMHVFAAHFDSTSWNIGVHFAQILRSDPMPKRFDLGPNYNMDKHGQLEAPVYNLSSVSAPIAIFHGYMDLYVDAKDMKRLSAQLGNVKMVEEVEHEMWAHQDFHLAINATKYHNRRLLQVLQSMRAT